MKVIRHAGLKDRLSTSRQWLCWPKAKQRDELTVTEEFKVIESVSHDRILSLGHVAMNHFRIILSHPEGQEMEEAVPECFPNFYGTQRFGNFDADQPVWPERKDRFLISQYQAALFNLFLAGRLKKIHWALCDGDLFTRTNGRRVFRVQTLDELEGEKTVSPAIPTGPILGYKMPKSSNTFEVDFMESRGIDPERFREFGKMAMGGRRPLWVYPQNMRVEKNGLETSILSFSLPSGSYATILLQTMLDPEFYLTDHKHWVCFD